MCVWGTFDIHCRDVSDFCHHYPHHWDNRPWESDGHQRIVMGVSTRVIVDPFTKMFIKFGVSFNKTPAKRRSLFRFELFQQHNLEKMFGT